MPVLEAHDVTKAFSEGRETVRVLHGVSLGARARRDRRARGSVGLRQDDVPVDPRLHPDARPPGRCAIDGEAVDPQRPERLPAIRKRSIGFVFQQFNLFPALTARENVEYALNIKGVRGEAARDEADARARRRSGSTTARTSCRATSRAARSSAWPSPARSPAGPAILLADEPTANLDSQVGTQVLGLFRDLAKREDRALLIVTHDPKVRTIADRVVRIRDGRIDA